MPPANDNIASAEAISGWTGSTTGTLVGATSETNERPNYHWQNLGAVTIQSVWYKYTPPTTGVVVFTLDDLGSGPLEGTIHFGSPSNPGDWVQWTIMHNGDNPVLVFQGVGNEIYIRIYSHGGLGDDFELSWDLPGTITPADDFADAPAISGAMVRQGAYLVDCSDSFTLESGEVPFVYTGVLQSAWLKITPPETRTYIFNSKPGITFHVFEGSSVSTMTGLPTVALSDTPGFRWKLQGGVTYHIGFFGYGTPIGVVPFTWISGLPPDNDDFDSDWGFGEHLGGGHLISSDLVTGYETGWIYLDGKTTYEGAGISQPGWYYASIEPPNDPDGYYYGAGPGKFSDRTVWFSFQPVKTGTLRLYVKNEPPGDPKEYFENTIGVYHGSSLASLTRISYCEFTSDINGIEGCCFAHVQEGQTYHIEVGSEAEYKWYADHPALYWTLFPDSAWAGEWGNPPPPSPNPGTVPSGADSLAAIWSQFGGSGIPTAPDYYSGAPLEWYAPIDGNDVIPTIGPYGAKFDLTPTNNGYGALDYPNRGSGLGGDRSVYTPSEAFSFTVGFIVENMQLSNDAGVESQNAFDPSWTIQPSYSGPFVFIRIGGGSYAGYMPLANDCRFRLKFIYNPAGAYTDEYGDSYRWKVMLQAGPDDPGIVCAYKDVGPVFTTNSSPWNMEVWADGLNDDGTGWSITYEGWGEMESPPPDPPPDLATLPGKYAVYHNGQWHIMRSDLLT